MSDRTKYARALVAGAREIITDKDARDENWKSKTSKASTIPTILSVVAAVGPGLNPYVGVAALILQTGLYLYRESKEV